MLFLRRLRWFRVQVCHPLWEVCTAQVVTAGGVETLVAAGGHFVIPVTSWSPADGEKPVKQVRG